MSMCNFILLVGYLGYSSILLLSNKKLIRTPNVMKLIKFLNLQHLIIFTQLVIAALTDPKKRLIYDTLGMRGIQMDVS